MLEKLRQLNGDIKIYSVYDEEFNSFGRVIDGLDVLEILEEANAIPMTQEGSSYTASVEAFEKLDIAKAIQDEFFGTLPSQIGYCWGHSNFLNATEWHSSSEINIAITPLVLILGHIWDIEDGKASSDNFKAFYLPEGCTVEVFATSTHFCPCEVTKEGFRCIVALPKGTNTDLEVKNHSPLLFRKNKWIICHEDNEPLKKRGVVPGITGINYEIKY